MNELKGLIKEFLDMLEETEVSESGSTFHPVYIGSCRVMKSKRIGEIISRIKEIIGGEQNEG